MRNVHNVVDFSELCIFAQDKGIAYYNEAHDVLLADAYPYPEDSLREVYLKELQYAKTPKAADILRAFMESKGVTYITVMKE